MKDEGIFNLEEFQKRVSAEFYRIYGVRQSDDFPTKDWKKAPGIIPKLTGWIFDKFLIKLVRRELEKRNYEEFNREAAVLIGKPEIKETVCRTIRETAQKEILTVDKFILSFTESLFEENLRNRFAILPDSMLFACAAYQVYVTGFEEFCNES